MSNTIDTRRPKQYIIKHYIRDDFFMVLAIYDQDKEPVDLFSKTLVLSIRSKLDGSAIATLTSTAGEITISGTDNNVLTFRKEITGLTSIPYYFDLDSVSDNESIITGVLQASYKGR